MELLVDNVREDSKPNSSNTVMILIAIVLALAVTGAYLQLRRS